MADYLFWQQSRRGPAAAPWAWWWLNRQPELYGGQVPLPVRCICPERAPGRDIARTAYDIAWPGSVDLYAAPAVESPFRGGGVLRMYARWERRQASLAAYELKVQPIIPSTRPLEIGSLVPDRAPGPERTAATAYGIRPWPVELYGGKPEEVLSLLPDRAPGVSRTAATAYGLRPWPVELYGGAPPSRLLPDRAPGPAVGSSAFKLLVPGTPDLYTAAVSPYYGGGVHRTLRSPHRWWAPQTAYGIPFLPVPPEGVVEALPAGFATFPHRVLSARLFSSWSQYGALGFPERPIEIGSFLPDRAYTPRASEAVYSFMRTGVVDLGIPFPPAARFLLPELAPGAKTASPGWFLSGTPDLYTLGSVPIEIGRLFPERAPGASRTAATAYGVQPWPIELYGGKPLEILSLLPDRAPGLSTSPDAYTIRAFQVELYGGQVPSTVRSLLPDRAPGAKTAAPGWFLAGGPDLYPLAPTPTGFGHLLPDRAPGPATARTAYQLVPFPVELYGGQVATTVRSLFAERAPGRSIASTAFQLWAYPQVGEYADVPVTVLRLFPDRAPGPQTARSAYIFFGRELAGVPLVLEIGSLVPERAPGPRAGGSAYTLFQPGVLDLYLPVLPRPIEIGNLLPNRAPGRATAVTAYLLPSAAPPPNHPFGSHPWWVPPPIMIGKHDEVSP